MLQLMGCSTLVRTVSGAEIRKEVTLEQPRDKVWSALTESHQLSQWFGARVELDPTLGGRVVFHWSNGTTRQAVVELVDAPRHLVLRWLPFEQAPDGSRRQLPPSSIRFTVEQDGQGSRLIVLEQELSAPAGGEPPPVLDGSDPAGPSLVGARYRGRAFV